MTERAQTTETNNEVSENHTTSQLILFLSSERPGSRNEALRLLMSRKPQLTDADAVGMLATVSLRPSGLETEIVRTVIGAKGISPKLRQQARQLLAASIRWHLRLRFPNPMVQ